MPEKILVVDDQATNRRLLEGLLAPRGFAVITAEDGHAALEAFARHQPDLVLLDVSMPNMDGFEVCRVLKSKPETRLVPVVMVTALTAKKDRIRGIECGADDFVTKPVELTQLLARVRSLLSLKAFTDELERAESVLFALARSIEGKDPYTQGHCERLADFSVRLGRCVGLPEEQLATLRRAAVLHDVGKIAVPDAILLKPGKLTPEEWVVMKRHPVEGERICAPLKAFRGVLPVIRHHHERMDGTGYPDGLKGEQIPFAARLMTIVDIYDALTTVRPYKHAFPQEQALAMLQEEVDKGWRDAHLFAEFRQMMLAGASPA